MMNTSSPAVRKKLRYGDADKANFKKYFSKKKKKGRPKKRKRGRPKKKKSKTTKQKKLSPVLVDLTRKAKAQLEATLEGCIESEKNKSKTRINWDLPENAARRQKIANSWTCKNDLYRAGDSYHRFCNRCDISRTVLTRFLENKSMRRSMASRKKGAEASLLYCPRA